MLLIFSSVLSSTFFLTISEKNEQSEAHCVVQKAQTKHAVVDTILPWILINSDGTGLSLRKSMMQITAQENVKSHLCNSMLTPMLCNLVQQQIHAAHPEK